MCLFGSIRKSIKYLLMITIFTLLFFWWFSNAQDLLWQAIEPAYDWSTIITIWKKVSTVWKTIIEWSDASIDIDWHWASVWKKSSLIVRVTKILLSLVIALSVTMILYNGMMYIIQTWQWKEAKDLTKNIAYIVIWILVALFSVVIITLIQSIPNSLENDDDGELISNQNHKNDDSVIKDVGKRIL